MRKFLYSCEKLFYIVVRKVSYSCEKNFDLDRFDKKALFENALCAFFISFCSYGSFLMVKKFLKIGVNFCDKFLAKKFDAK